MKIKFVISSIFILQVFIFIVLYCVIIVILFCILKFISCLTMLYFFIIFVYIYNGTKTHIVCKKYLTIFSTVKLLYIYFILYSLNLYSVLQFFGSFFEFVVWILCLWVGWKTIYTSMFWWCIYWPSPKRWIIVLFFFILFIHYYYYLLNFICYHLFWKTWILNWFLNIFTV